VLLPLLAAASLLYPLPVSTLTGKADVILRGTVISKSVLRDPENRIYTKVELQVSEVWKGSLTTNRFTTVLGGGVLGEQRVEVSDQVEYEIGEEVIGFYALNPRGEGVSIGMSQGKFHVYTDAADGAIVANNPFHGRPQAAAGAPGLTAGGQSPAPRKDRLTADNLKKQVQGGGK